MKKIILLLLLFVTFAGSIFAVPRYMTKDTAVSLALSVEKAKYDGFLILAAYAMNREDNYYIAVTLSNGRTERWFLEDIYNFSKDNRLLLRNNRVIVFPDEETGEFVILDKNLFHRMAIQANIYKQAYVSYDDPLSGQSLFYLIKNFSIIGLDNHSFGKDPHGYAYRYKLDFNECDSVMLSYRDAVEAIRTQRLLRDFGTTDIRALDKPYRVTGITGFNKIPNRIFSQFGILITFDRDINLTPRNFPVSIGERYEGAKDGTSKRNFYVEVLLPHTKTTKTINLNYQDALNNLEYLSEVKVVKDRKNPCRSVLRAYFNKDVMDIPPYITKIDSNKIYVTFFNIVDQTVSRPPVTIEEGEEIVLESPTWLSVSPSIEANTSFGKAYAQALDTVNKGHSAESYIESIKLMEQGIVELEEAGLLAKDDSQLIEILSQRNKVRNQIVYASMEHAQKQISGNNPNLQAAGLALDIANSYADNKRQQYEIDRLRRKIQS